MGDFRRDSAVEWDDGWSRAPHGLWTLDLPAGAKVLLGWLHSHSGEFLSGVTINQARRAVGSSSIAAWFDALEAAGFLQIERKTNGKPSSIVLLTAPWLALIGNRNRAEIGSVTAPKSDRTEDHREDQCSSSLRSEEELDVQVREHTPVAEPEPEIAKEFWDWHVADRGKEPVTKFMALRSVAKVLQKRGYGRDEIIDAMKTSRLMTAKSLSDEIAAKRHAAEGTVNTAAIPQALVRAWVRAKPWIKGKVDASDETLDYWLRCCAAQMRFGYGVGETMIRFAVALRANNVTSFGLTDVQGVDRFAGELADYPDAMERAWRNRYWRAS